MIKTIGKFEITTGNDIFFTDDIKLIYDKQNYDLYGYVDKNGKLNYCKTKIPKSNIIDVCVGNKLYYKIYDIYVTGNDKRVNSFFNDINERVLHNVDNNGDLIERDYYYIRCELLK